MKFIIREILKGQLLIKKDESIECVNLDDKSLIIEKIESIFEYEEKKQLVILARGTKKKILTDRLVNKINSNDSLYDGIFLVGEKAKNYLHKRIDIEHLIKAISNYDSSVAEWIFDEYSLFNLKNIDIKYFKNPLNKSSFISKVKNIEELINYYLFGLHTLNSGLLLNFVSSTKNYSTALDCNNDLIIFFWLPANYKKFSVSKETLVKLKPKIKKLKLPELYDSIKPSEEEYSIKGFILPHYIIGVYDVLGKSFILNPKILEFKENWIADGFDIDYMTFLEFICSTKYERFLTLIDNSILIEKNVC